MRKVMRTLLAARASAGRPVQTGQRCGQPAGPLARAPRPGPGPSRTAYRLSRIWMKARVRRAALALPLVVVALIAARLAADPEVRAMLAERRDAVIAALSQRPEFAVRDLRVIGASERLTGEIRRAADLAPNASSLTIDVDVVQASVAAMGGVRSARVKLGPDGVLLIAVDERAPEALWRDDEGRLWLADRQGVAIALAGPRAGHPKLPVVIGEGAQAAMEEALALFRAAPDLHERLRAFVRVGERRWDLVLDRDLRIMLPADHPLAALARVMALHYGEELLDRDLAAIDMRLGARPTLRPTPDAAEIMRLREIASDPGKEA